MVNFSVISVHDTTHCVSFSGYERRKSACLSPSVIKTDSAQLCGTQNLPGCRQGVHTKNIPQNLVMYCIFLHDSALRTTNRHKESGKENDHNSLLLMMTINPLLKEMPPLFTPLLISDISNRVTCQLFHVNHL